MTEDASLVYYGDILNLKDYDFHWDEDAKVPYATDKNGKFVLCYEDTNSVAIKSEYVLENDLCGIMYWEYTLDAQDLPLVKTIYKTINKE